MNSQIVFEMDSQYEPLRVPSAQPVGVVSYLQKKGFAHSREEAFVLVVVVLSIFMGISFSLFKGALPDVPVLGVDVLQPGEVIPEYVK